jgi:hypothetical protein
LSKLENVCHLPKVLGLMNSEMNKLISFLFFLAPKIILFGRPIAQKYIFQFMLPGSVTPNSDDDDTDFLTMMYSNILDLHVVLFLSCNWVLFPSSGDNMN